MRNDVKELRSELLSDLNDADDPSEAIGNIKNRLYSVGDGTDCVSFENAYDLPSAFRERFYFLTLLNPKEEMGRETDGTYSLPFTTHYFTDFSNELEQYAGSVISYISNQNPHFMDWNKISVYAGNNTGKYWIFIPSKHRDGSRSVRKATWTDAKRAYKVAYKLTIVPLIKMDKGSI